MILSGDEIYEKLGRDVVIDPFDKLNCTVVVGFYH